MLELEPEPELPPLHRPCERLAALWRRQGAGVAELRRGGAWAGHRNSSGALVAATRSRSKRKSEGRPSKLCPPSCLAGRRGDRDLHAQPEKLKSEARTQDTQETQESVRTCRKQTSTVK
eukprot:scaffold70971_cov74-Phaeocystis_antarctica.AAC.4